MSWAKLDDAYAMHPKVLLAGNEAVGLHARSISWCAQHGTDGEIPEPAARAMGRPATIQKLLDVGLWERRNGSYWVHDYLDFNPSRDEALREQAAARERMRRVRANKRQTKGGRS